MISQQEKAAAFEALHARAEPFIIPNPWDLGSARMLVGQGFEALATTSAGFVFSQGRPEGTLGRDDVLAHVRELCAACPVPISADLEDGYGEDPEGVAETIRRAADAGLVGGSVEDAKIATASPIYEFGEAVERVRAAVEAARSLPFKFMLTARSENFLYGRPDLDDTIKRLQAFQEAGADVLYAPGLTRLDQIAAVTASVDRPVNVVVGLPNTQFSVAELAKAGVRRISVGSALFRKAFGMAVAAAQEMKTAGTFTFAADAMSFGEINGMLGGAATAPWNVETTPS